jgi:hypothetical protein
MLKKLSLAALIAMGSMSVASATPLTDAIKGVNLNGKLRVRFYNYQPDNGATYDRWRTNAVFIFSVPASENISFVVRNSVQTQVYTSANDINVGGTSTNVDDSIVNNLVFMKYSNGPVNAILGKIPVATSITSADFYAPGHGAGAVATYKVNDNLTVGAAFVDALKNGATLVTAKDIYAAVAVFNADMVSGNAWYYKITNLSKYIFTASVNVKPADGIAVHADYATGKDDVTGAKSSNYYNINAKYSSKAFCVKLGYAHTNDGNSMVSTSNDAPISAIAPVETRYALTSVPDADMIYAKAAYNIDAKTNVYIGYATIDQSQSAGDADSNEYQIGANYAYTKKLGFQLWYDSIDYDHNAGTDTDIIRFQAQYSF